MQECAVENLSTVKGRFKRNIFRGDNYFCISVFTLVEATDPIPKSIENSGEFVAVGSRIPELDVFNVNLTGRWERNKKRGDMQFKVSFHEEEEPVSKEGIIKVLSCGIYKGIGEKTADKIYKRFGKDSIRVINDETDRLREIKGIGPVVIANLIETVKETVELRKLAEFLAVYDVSVNKIKKIQKAFPENAYELIREEPFRLCEIPGFGFKTVDAIAEKLGTPLNSPLRIHAAIAETLRENNSRGNLYDEKENLIKQTLALLNNRPGEKVTADTVQAEIQAMCIDLKLAIEKNCEGTDIVYRQEDYLNETQAAMHLSRLLKSPLDVRLMFSKPQMEKEIALAESEFGMSFAPKQKAAIEAALNSKVCVITGGPGTGKTTILRAILSIYKRNVARSYPPDEQPVPLLLSPTGKAARRMSESARESAYTIHKGLGITPADAHGACSDESMITNETGIIFVDEVSMADMAIWSRLVSEIPDRAQLVAIGDVDQLPSVGAGSVLSDMISSGVIPVVRLDVIYRQGKTSLIVQNAHKIKNGEQDIRVSKAEFAFFGFPSKEENPHADEDAQTEIINMYLRAVRKYGIGETQILCPRREEVTASAFVINQKIQEILFASNPSAIKFHACGKTFYVGDRIIQTKNTSKANNGDMGVITAARTDPEQEGAWIATIVFDFMENGDSAEYYSEELEDILLGYSITCHKSQGSEFKAVLIPVLQSQVHMLKRNLLYTAVTRGKEFVGLFGQTSALRHAIRTQDTSKRKTLYSVRLREALLGCCE